MKKIGKVLLWVLSIAAISAAVACVVSQFLNKHRFFEVDISED